MLRRLPLLRLSAPRLAPRRRNPDTPADVAPAKWKDAVDRSKQDLYSDLMSARKALLSVGVDGATLPEPLYLRKHAENLSLLWASSPYAELQTQSRLKTPAPEVVGALFSPFNTASVQAVPEAAALLDAAKGAALTNLNNLRQQALAKIAVGAERVQEGAVEARIRALAKEEEDTRAKAAKAKAAKAMDGEPQDPADLRKELGGWTKAALTKEANRLGTDPADSAKMSKLDLVQHLVEYAFPADDDADDDDNDDDDDDDGYAASEAALDIAEADDAPEPPKARRTGGKTASPGVPSRPAAERAERPSRKGERVGFDREALLTRTRVTARNDAEYVPPSPEVMAEARSDILLYLLKRGITQVWIKGALTVSFTASQGKGSWMVAKDYARDWLEQTNENGVIKKSRFNTRVLFSAEEEPLAFEVIVQSQAEREAAKLRKVPSREAVLAQLRGEGKQKANPRGGRTRPFRSLRARAVVAELRSSFRRNGYAVPVLAALGGFAAGAYARPALETPLAKARAFISDFERDTRPVEEAAPARTPGSAWKARPGKKAGQVEWERSLGGRMYFILSDNKKHFLDGEEGRIYPPHGGEAFSSFAAARAAAEKDAYARRRGSR